MKTEILPTIFAIRWASKWAGDVPGPRTVRAYFTRTAAETDEFLGKETYDGFSARTEGSYGLVGITPSKRLQTLHKQGVTFGLTGAYEAGAWFDKTPVASAYSRGQWAWKLDEYLYIEALWAAKNPEDWAAIHA